MENLHQVFLLLPDRRIRRELVHELNEANDYALQGMVDSFEDLDLTYLVSNPPHILVADFDRTEARELRLWSAIKCFLPMDIRIVALTDGADEKTLEIILAIGVHALHPPDISGGRLMEAISNASLGQVDFDQDLAQHAKLLFLGPSRPDRVAVGGLSIPLRRPVISRWGQEITLSPLEARVIQYLALNKDRWITIDELLDVVWKTEKKSGGTADQVKSCIKRLKAKMEPDSENPRYLLSSRSEGYKLHDPFV